MNDMIVKIIMLYFFLVLEEELYIIYDFFICVLYMFWKIRKIDVWVLKNLLRLKINIEFMMKIMCYGFLVFCLKN